MKFVDEARMTVKAGNGGRGCLSFRREKSAPFGGPDGGDGGLGGDIWLQAAEGINTLADFRIERTYKAQNGQPGSGNDCSGRGGDDLIVLVPVGTIIKDRDTQELLGDLTPKHDTLHIKRIVVIAVSTTKIRTLFELGSKRSHCHIIDNNFTVYPIVYRQIVTICKNTIQSTQIRNGVMDIKRDTSIFDRYVIDLLIKFWIVL